MRWHGLFRRQPAEDHHCTGVCTGPETELWRSSPRAVWTLAQVTLCIVAAGAKGKGAGVLLILGGSG